MAPCDICRDLDESVPSAHGVPLSRIRESHTGSWFTRGCQKCGVLLQCILAFKNDSDQEKNLVASWNTSRLHNGLRVGARLDSDDVTTVSFTVDLFCLDGDKPPWKFEKHGEVATEISGDTTSDAAILKIRAWMRECDQKHNCGRPWSPPYFPSRVLDISDPNFVRLHHVTGKESGGYACLSHCWGTTRFLTTTQSNLDDHYSHIPWASLPKSFQDAITITRRLRIPYLWVDSLCIVQDDKEDWKHESGEMADIYASSKITLSASMARSDLNGFTSSTPAQYLSRTLKYRSEDGSTQTIRMRKTLTHGVGPASLPLLSRGWVLQERLLSPRVVHFTSDELIWECTEKTTCECNCIRSLWAPGFVPFNKDILYEPNLSKASKTELTLTWHQIIEQYSRLDLSFSRDRLPAISGAAHRFSPYKRCEYYCGLWANSFVRDLMWARKGVLETSRRLAHVPTWSWISIDNQVTYDEAVSTTELAVVLEFRRSSRVDEDDHVMHQIWRSSESPNEEFSRIWRTTVVSGLLTSLRAFKDRERPRHVLSADSSVHPFEELAKLGDFVPDIKEDHVQYSMADVHCLRLATQEGVMGAGDNQEISLVLLLYDAGSNRCLRLGLLKRRFHGFIPDVDLYEGITEPTAVSLL